MGEILAIAQRRISGTGLILPAFADLKHRRYTLFADIIRKPRTPYLNRESQPPETYYGVISLMKDGYVLQTYKIKFDSQIWIFDADISGEVLIAVKCQYLGVLQTFVNLGVALNLVPISVENTIGNYKALPLQWDSINVQCFADSAIQFVLKALTYDSCETDYLDPEIPAQPPNKPAAVPPGIGTNIDPAYSGDTTTNPVQIDRDFEPAPIGQFCVGHTLSWTYTYSVNGAPIQTTNAASAVLGPVSVAFRTKPGEPNVLQTKHRGSPFFGGCQEYEYRDILSTGAGTVILSWYNIAV